MIIQGNNALCIQAVLDEANYVNCRFVKKKVWSWLYLCLYELFTQI